MTLPAAVLRAGLGCVAMLVAGSVLLIGGLHMAWGKGAGSILLGIGMIMLGWNLVRP